jgi:hypothetical protein
VSNSNKSSSDGAQNSGKNLGHGLGGVNDNPRRDLAGSGDEAPTQDQRETVTSDQKGRQNSSDDRRATRH